ncbi:hypothetical protein Fmac_005738 [Flemingia macrophylla]|uniref:Uncharacterized protein n=1 Tax=Flemingia macrophylla TaxID=520843 RepID=A0ABD1N8Z8_9FABA
MGLCASYSSMILRNLPADVMVLKVTKHNHLKPFQSVLCGAPADIISASVTMSLDNAKTLQERAVKHMKNRKCND